MSPHLLGDLRKSYRDALARHASQNSHRTLQSALLAERARVAAIVESSGDAIMSLTTDGVIEGWNPSAQRLYGYHAEEAVGKDLLALLARDPGEREATLTSAAAGNGPVQSECQDIRKDGSILQVCETNTPIRDSKGRVIGFARIARDLTTRARAQEAMQKADAVAAAALADALEASRMKSSFLANMSHEIRTPLNGVIGMAELLLDSHLNAEQRENARLLKAAGETLVTVVNDVLDFSKIEAGAMRLEYTDFDLVEAVEDVCDLMGEAARAKDIELTMELDPALPTSVRGDTARVREIVANLISNAMKFTSKGEICVSLQLMPSSDALSQVRFEVSDTGIGIEKSKLGKLFEPFVQADDSTTRQFGGTGLGLAIVKQLVDMMGGEVGVTSVLGEGSRFWFTLVFEPSETPEEPYDEPALAGIRLLAVDDNETNRRLITQLGNRWDMHVTAVAGGAEALVQLREAGAAGKPFDCATLDMHMPSMDGIELADAIGCDETFKTPALVMLASTMEQRRAARKSGIAVYMTKPIRRTRLQRALIEALGLQTRRLQAPSEVQGAAASGRSPVILVADDNDINQLVAVRMLERRGYRVRAVADGRQALDALQRHSYAAILMDCQMPELDGYDATRELRSRESSDAHTPVIAMTAHALASDRAKCLAAGMDDYIAKPINTVQLERVLSRWAPTTVRESLVAGSREGGESKPRGPHAGAALLEPTGASRLLSELGSAEALAALVEVFATKTPELLTDMRLAVERGDGASVKDIAHKLRGSCLSLSAVRMAEICAELQTQANVSLDGAAALLDELHDAFEETHDALLAVLT